jgi:predicted nuclease of restriction endonuclease-like RecB superfamily
MHPSAFLYYAGAFALVVVGATLAYALIRLGNALGGLNKVIGDVEKELPETMKNVRETVEYARTAADNAAQASGALADSASQVREVVGKVAGTITFINDNLISKITVVVNIVGFVTDFVTKIFGERFAAETAKSVKSGGENESEEAE